MTRSTAAMLGALALVTALPALAQDAPAAPPAASAEPAAAQPAPAEPPASEPVPAAVAPDWEQGDTGQPAAEPAGSGMSASASLDDLGEPGDGEGPLVSRMDSGVVIGGKVGGGLGTGADLGGTFVVELELGYALPFADRALEIFLAGFYTQPGTDGTIGGPDDRLPDPGSFSYEVTQQELALTLGGLYRIDVGSDSLMPYLGAGPRLYFLNTKIDGDASGAGFGENEEKQAAFGLAALGGLDFFVGPGALLAELSFGWAPVDSFVLRNTNVGQINLAVGYRFML